MAQMGYDVVVVGSGIAGLSFALEVAQKGYSVAIITKKNRADSNTNYAQGGIACVTSKGDAFDLHIKDTLDAGDGLNDESVARKIVEEAPACIEELIQFGVQFSQEQNGSFSLGQEGGHSQRRILHANDVTGKVIESALLDSVAKLKNIEVLEHFFAIDLITLKKNFPEHYSKHNEVLGLYALDTNKGEVKTFAAKVILIATGGIGQAYQFTTNPDIATGDGIAMAYRAGVGISNMEFVQFHPTALYTKDDDRFLISEAIRGEGAILRDMEGNSFMPKYDTRGDLASRDIVARAIDLEMQQSGSKHVWLDITHESDDYLKKRFPHIFETLLQRGINMAKDYIPVVPAAHYLCGGIVTNISAETELPGLYACGEAACTGLHGANRLASNSLLEAVVMARRGARSVIDYLKRYQDDSMPLPSWVSGDIQDSDERVVLSHNWEELKQTMWDYVGIVRSTKRLQRAKTRIQNLSNEINEYYWDFKVEPKLLELRNLTQVALLVIECAMQRKESRGLHYTLDYLEKLEDAKPSYIIKPEEKEICASK